jgi:hypothetical protein
MAIDAAADDLDSEFYRVLNNDDHFPAVTALGDRISEALKQSSIGFGELPAVHDRCAQRRAPGDHHNVAHHLLWFTGDLDRGCNLVEGIEKVGSLR